ncbi:hypothetical protein H0H87_001132 [Tephrocybe sp. NHM501043]|nr:hypothetical protein H0H87_001132 [Tephrocybe sp. NHM501043]
MANTAPPSYYASNFTTHYESISAYAKLGDNTWTDAQTKTFLKHVNDTLNDDTVLQELEAEIDKLQDATNTIKTVFSTVKNEFQTVHDKPGVHDDFKSAVAALMVRWDQFGETFEDIKKRAKRNATNAQVIAKDFSTNFVTFLERRDKSLEEKKNEAKTYETFIRGDVEKASKIETDLENLVAAIKVFDNDWKKVAEAEQQKLDDDIKEFDTKIKKLKEEIDSLTTKINKEISSVVLSFVGIGVCILAGFLCPAFWFGTVIFTGLGAFSGTLLGSDVTKRNNKEKEKADLETKMGNASQAKKDIQALLSGVTSVHNECQKAFTAIKAFEDVWQSITNDLNGIIQSLELVERGTADADLAYVRLGSIKATYNRIGHAMDYYARKA